MKVLIVHNAYRHRGGEDMVVQAESQLLDSYGHEVITYTRHNDEIATMGRVDLALQALWSSRTAQALDDTLLSFRPDVVHVHNTLPLISPRVYWAAAKHSVPVVQTLHNFRLLCLQANFLRDGQVCEDCLGRLPWRGATRGCYRSSRVQSSVQLGMLALHRALGTYRNKINRYIALNEFCRRKFIEGGLPPERIVVKPNFADIDEPAMQQRGGFLFVGRLAEEKGIAALATAASSIPDTTVRVIGTGPATPLLRIATQLIPLGALDQDKVVAEMARAKALILPSIAYEGHPRTLVEAFACALPVIAPRLGPLEDLIEDGVTGLHFEPGRIDDLARKMRWAMANPSRMAQMGRNARKVYETQFAPASNYAELMAIYQAVINEAAKSRTASEVD